jgi:hypothetical protein
MGSASPNRPNHKTTKDTRHDEKQIQMEEHQVARLQRE